MSFIPRSCITCYEAKTIFNLGMLGQIFLGKAHKFYGGQKLMSPGDFLKNQNQMSV